MVIALQVAATSAQEPPLAGRPKQFSQVVGEYTLEVTATPAQVAVEEPITLRLHITGNGPPQYQPRREHLRVLPEDLSDDFYVEPVPEQDVARPAEGRWEFVYRLRPKHERVTEIGGLTLVTWSPRRKAYQRGVADAVPITVLPRRAAVVPEGVAIQPHPASFYEPPGDDILRRDPEPGVVPLWLVILALLGTPVVIVPLARRLRKRETGDTLTYPAMTQRLARLDASRSAEDVRAEVVAHLRTTFGWASEEPTPREVHRFLRGRQVSRSVARDVEALLQACDAARFANAAPDVNALRREAARALTELAGCVSRTPREIMPRSGVAPGAFHTPYLALVASLAMGQTDADLLARARTRFEQGQEASRRPADARRFFGAAADDLHELHRHGYRSAGLYLHLGDAALLADQVPRAIWAYHQGLRLDRGHQGLREHLAYARGLVGTTPAAPVLRWGFHPAPGVLLLVAALAYFVAWLSAAVWYASGRRRHLVALTTCSLLAALTGWAYVDSARRQELDRREPLVVVNEPASLHRGNGASYPHHPDTPTLPAGLEARQLHRRGSWLLVRLESGQVGWVRAAHVIADEPAVAP